eukprot:9988041-Alexandrium_andersonii.AAC.1
MRACAKPPKATRLPHVVGTCAHSAVQNDAGAHGFAGRMPTLMPDRVYDLAAPQRSKCRAAAH